jgi:hypothetical protein
MPWENKAKATGSKVNELQAKTRLLLALWDLGATQTQVMKGKVTPRVVPKDLKVADYQGIFDQLEQEGAIAFAKNKFSLLPQGVELLGECLKNPQVQFQGTIVGTWVANALLKWIAQMDGGVGKAIASYEEFQQVALDVYNQLNRDYHLEHLVPIYRMRREIGDRVGRSHFNEWLLEMQANNVFQLMGGEMPDITPDKAEDSITTELSGLRYYAKRLDSKI